MHQTRRVDYYAVYDACSTDSTQQVLNRFRNLPGLTRLVVSPDDGQADAINRGFNAMPGDIDIMAYLNSDDLLEKDAVATAMQVFEDHPDTDLVTGWSCLIGPRGRRGMVTKSFPRSRNDMLVATGISQETTFWRMDLYQRAGGYVDPTYKFALDSELWLRMSEAGWRPTYLNKVLGCFRIHPESKSTSKFWEVGLVEVNRIRTTRGLPALSGEDFLGRVRAIQQQELGMIGYKYYIYKYKIYHRWLLPHWL